MFVVVVNGAIYQVAELLSRISHAIKCNCFFFKWLKILWPQIENLAVFITIIGKLARMLVNWAKIFGQAKKSLQSVQVTCWKNVLGLSIVQLWAKCNWLVQALEQLFNSTIEASGWIVKVRKTGGNVLKLRNSSFIFSGRVGPLVGHCFFILLIFNCRPIEAIGNRLKLDSSMQQ